VDRDARVGNYGDEADEGGLQEEGGEGLHREGRAEDVADVARVLAPVHPELELLDDPGHDPDGEADEHEPAPEPHHAGVHGPARAVARGLEHGHEGGQADAERHEDEVEDGGDAELQARELEGRHRRGCTAAVPCAEPALTETSSTRIVPPRRGGNSARDARSGAPGGHGS